MTNPHEPAKQKASIRPSDWPSLTDKPIKGSKYIERIAKRDALVFGFGSNTLVFIAWCTFTAASFNCMAQQRPHAVITAALWIMAAYGVVMAFRLFGSVGETANYLLGDPFKERRDVPRMMLAIAAMLIFTFMAYGLAFVISSAVVQSSTSCWMLPASMFEPSDELL
jgi:hypothetical protein